MLASTKVELCTAKEKVSTSQHDLEVANEDNAKKIASIEHQHKQEKEESERRHQIFVNDLKKQHRDAEERNKEKIARMVQQHEEEKQEIEKHHELFVKELKEHHEDDRKALDERK